MALIWDRPRKGLNGVPPPEYMREGTVDKKTRVGFLGGMRLPRIRGILYQGPDNLGLTSRGFTREAKNR